MCRDSPTIIARIRLSLTALHRCGSHTSIAAHMSLYMHSRPRSIRISRRSAFHRLSRQRATRNRCIQTGTLSCSSGWKCTLKMSVVNLLFNIGAAFSCRISGQHAHAFHSEVVAFITPCAIIASFTPHVLHVKEPGETTCELLW